MKNNLVITNRKVANLTDFCETIELKGMQFFFSCIFLIKIQDRRGERHAHRLSLQ